jgi:hypothetical protein
VIRSTFGIVLGPRPEPWRSALAYLATKLPAVWDAIGPIGLNPQPLPPRVAIVAALGQAAVARAELIGEAALAAGREGAGGAYLVGLIDDWCGTPPRPFPWPWPGPRPEWALDVVGPCDHAVMAGVMDAALRSGVGEDLGHGLDRARERLIAATGFG